jgi:SAM-dependent methyltransferase
MTLNVCTTAPINKDYGIYQGVPIARHYIDVYMRGVKERINGRVLEFGWPTYAADFDCTYEIVDINANNQTANIHTDICCETAREDLIGRYDFIICTAVLQLVSDPAKAVRNMHMMLKPEGTLILAEKCISKVDSWDPDIDRWRFTPNGLRFLLNAFSNVEVESYGNVFAICAYLLGMPYDQVDQEKLKVVDPEHPLVAIAYARK